MEAFVFNNAERVSAWLANNTILYAISFILIYTAATVFGLPISIILSLGGGRCLIPRLRFLARGFLINLFGLVIGFWGLLGLI